MVSQSAAREDTLRVMVSQSAARKGKKNEKKSGVLCTPDLTTFFACDIMQVQQRRGDPAAYIPKKQVGSKIGLLFFVSLMLDNLFCV